MSNVTTAAGIQLRSVLTATDFSKASEKPLHHALAIARSYGAKFYVAHVVSSLGFTLAGPDATCAAEDAIRRDACRLEQELTATGELAGIRHQIILRQGEVWHELEQMIEQEHVDLVVLGTHGRHGLGKLLLGSVAEQIFRQAHCPLLTVGPNSYVEPRVENAARNRPFLFATDFGEASLQTLPYAVSFANQFAAKLVLFHAVPTVLMPEDFKVYTTSDVAQLQEEARGFALKRLKQLVQNEALDVTPEFMVGRNALGPVSEDILGVAEKLRADLIIMGLHRPAHFGGASHVPWTTAYEVVCGAGCPVLTVRGEVRKL